MVTIDCSSTPKCGSFPFLVGVLSLLAACSSTLTFSDGGGENLVEGVVIDDATGQTLSNSYVILQYYAKVSDWPHSVDTTDYCYLSAVAKTDEAGRFAFPPQVDHWKGRGVKGYFQYLMAYRTGYIFGAISDGAVPHVWTKQAVTTQNTVALKFHSSSIAARLEYLRALIGATGGGLFHCLYFPAETDQSHVQVMKAIYEEARQLAQTDAEKAQVTEICNDAMMYHDFISKDYFPDLFPEPCVFDVEHFEKLEERRKERSEIIRRERELR